MRMILATDRISSLDISRSIAILLVIAVHTFQAFPLPAAIAPIAALGRFGVQLFFIVSAYTMCLMWTAREGEPARLYKFYARRLLRIAPLFWLFVLVYLLANGVGPNRWAPEGVNLSTVLMTLTFTHSMTPETMNAIVSGGWSISDEMIFYVCFPLLATFLLKGSARITITAAIIWHVTYSIIAMDVQPIGNAALFDDFLYLNPLNQMPVFMIGIAAFQNRERGAFADWPMFAIWIALSVSTAEIGLMSAKSAEFIVVVVALYGAFVAVERLPRAIMNIMPKAATLVGQRSYGIYLSHFLVLSCLGSIIGHGSPGYLQFAAAFMFTLLASYMIAARLEDAVSFAISPIRRALIDNRYASSPSPPDAVASPYYSRGPIPSSVGPSQ